VGTFEPRPVFDVTTIGTDGIAAFVPNATGTVQDEVGGDAIPVYDAAGALIADGVISTNEMGLHEFFTTHPPGGDPYDREFVRLTFGVTSMRVASVETLESGPEARATADQALTTAQLADAKADTALAASRVPPAGSVTDLSVAENAAIDPDKVFGTAMTLSDIGSLVPPLDATTGQIPAAYLPADIGGGGGATDMQVSIADGTIPSGTYNVEPGGILGGGTTWAGLRLHAGTAPVGGTGITVQIRDSDATTILASVTLPSGQTDQITAVTFTTADIFHVFVTGVGTTTPGADVWVALLLDVA
jgi:hypothetical protein